MFLLTEERKCWLISNRWSSFTGFVMCLWLINIETGEKLTSRIAHGYSVINISLILSCFTKVGYKWFSRSGCLYKEFFWALCSILKFEWRLYMSALVYHERVALRKTNCRSTVTFRNRSFIPSHRLWAWSSNCELWYVLSVVSLELSQLLRSPAYVLSANLQRPSSVASVPTGLHLVGPLWDSDSRLAGQ